MRVAVITEQLRRSASPVPSATGVAHQVDPMDVDSIAAGLVAAGSDERRAELVAAGRAHARHPHLGGRRPSQRGGVGGGGRVSERTRSEPMWWSRATIVMVAR